MVNFTKHLEYESNKNEGAAYLVLVIFRCSFARLLSDTGLESTLLNKITVLESNIGIAT